MAFICLGGASIHLHAQDSVLNKSSFKSRIYIDAYYSYDFSMPVNKEKAAFLFNHNRHNEININLALAGISFRKERIRMNMGFMAGSYVRYNLSDEPKLLQHVFEANAGVKISSKQNLWLDIGIMPSHIGFESAISKESWTITRSMLAENSPYYETGAKLSYTSKNEKWYAAALVLNGWQRIRRIPGNHTPSWGSQLTYKPSEKWSVNWSTFIGNNMPDTARRWRYFNNFFAIWQLTKEWGLILGVDYGFEQKAIRSRYFNKWYSPVAIVRYEKQKWAAAARIERYQDKEGVIMPLVNNRPFNMRGYSANIDRKIGTHSLARMEWRMLSSSSPYFREANRYSTSNHFITASVVMDIVKNRFNSRRKR